MKKYITLAAIALAFAACTQEDIAPQDNQKDTPITILSAGVAELSTRAVTDGRLVGTEDAPVEMGVFVTDGSADEYNCFNAKFTHDGTSWTGETVLYEGSNSQQKIYAIYPYNEEYSSDKTVGGYEIYITQNQLEEPQIDYLYSEPMLIESNRVSLTMQHLLTRLVLEVTLGTEVEADDKIAKVEVQGMYETSRWWAEDDTWAHPDSRETTISMKQNSETSFEAIVLPVCGCDMNDECISFPLVITMESGRIFKTDISCPAVMMVDEKYIYGLAQGFHYNITLQVGQDKVVLEGIAAAPWGEPVEGGQLETE